MSFRANPKKEKSKNSSVRAIDLGDADVQGTNR
jgi:hypothetical protein